MSFQTTTEILRGPRPFMMTAYRVSHHLRYPGCREKQDELNKQLFTWHPMESEIGGNRMTRDPKFCCAVQIPYQSHGGVLLPSRLSGLAREVPAVDLVSEASLKKTLPCRSAVMLAAVFVDREKPQR